ncbi:MAG: transporter [Desulfuromonadaceae bacterium]|nr:transporter [Desulfuromonadaceae bacterium]MDD2854770.1 transporter [Desulfuromonadaceae bacterium]
MIVRKRILFSLTALLIFSAKPGMAAHPLIGDDAGTLGKSSMQLELNGDISRENETVSGSTTRETGKQLAVAFGIGLTERVDLSIGFARAWSNGNSDDVSFKDTGSADFSMNLKWQFYEQGGVSAAIKPQFGFSYIVGDSEDHVANYGAALVVSKEFEPFALHLNTGYSYNDYKLQAAKDLCRKSTLDFSLAATYQATKNITLVTDFGGSTSDEKASDKMPIFLLAGAIYAVNDNLDLSGGVKAGLTDREDDLCGTFGATFKF